MKRSHAGYHLSASLVVMIVGCALLFGATPTQAAEVFAGALVFVWFLAALYAL